MSLSPAGRDSQYCISASRSRNRIFNWSRAQDATTGPSLGGKVQVLRDSKGLLAWMPWEHGTGSRGAVRYVKGTWTPLGPDQGWPERIAYLVPLLDGTVFQFRLG